MGKSKRRKLSADEQHVLDHLQVRLLSSPQDKARCDQLIVEHHYLQDATLVGEQLRYVTTYKGRWLALATWSAAAFHLKDRDEFIGWDLELCRRRCGASSSFCQLLGQTLRSAAPIGGGLLLIANGVSIRAPRTGTGRLTVCQPPGTAHNTFQSAPRARARGDFS